MSVVADLTPLPYRQAAASLRRQAAAWSDAAHDFDVRLRDVTLHRDDVLRAWTSPLATRVATDIDALTERYLPVADVLRTGAEALRGLATLAEEVATRLTAFDLAASDVRSQRDALRRQMHMLTPDEPTTAFDRRIDEASQQMDAIVRGRSGVLEAWENGCALYAQKIASLSNILELFALPSQLLGPAIVSVASGALYARRIQGRPVVEESWTVLIYAEAAVAFGGRVEIMYEVRRLSNGRFEVVERQLLAGTAQAGPEARVGFTWGEPTSGLDAGATVGALLGLQSERTFDVVSEHDVGLLITNLVMQLQGVNVAGLGFEGGNTLDNVADKLTIKQLDGVGRWFSDKFDDVPGMPNIADWRQKMEEVADFDMPDAKSSYTAIEERTDARASWKQGGPFAGDGFDAEAGVSVARTYGSVDGPHGTHGYRAVYSVDALLQAGFEIDGVHGLDQGAVLDVMSTYTGDDLTSVTMNLSTANRDSVTVRTTVIDATQPESYDDARAVVDFALTPGPLVPAAAAAFVTALQSPTDGTGISHAEKTYASAASDYGAFFEIGPVLGELGLEGGVTVTHNR
jgi:hypothetical protein